MVFTILESNKEKLINFMINIDNKSKAAWSNDTLLLTETKTDEEGEEVAHWFKLLQRNIARSCYRNLLNSCWIMVILSRKAD